MKKMYSGILILVGTLTILFSLRQFQGENQESSFAKPESRLSEHIHKDIQFLLDSKELPKEWALLKEQKLTSTSSQTDKWVKDIDLKIQTTKIGTYRLESVLIAESPSDPNSRLMVQYGIYDLKSGNKIWEKIRIYDVK